MIVTSYDTNDIINSITHKLKVECKDNIKGIQ